ncbi:mediator complex subunit 1 isoform X2 [Brevipalpus obovatus]|uniref:mediator complex subunit 1 isoform X2 n=1 Tax=Brevipalpus obovatus TaxID=246614 RepID=UPI003D9DB146
MAKSTSDWVDVIKLVRSALFEKRPFVMNDTAERNQVQKCLDVIQKSIRITSLTSMKERLETITRQLNLKLKTGPTNRELFIFTEMFLVEIQLNPETGQVLDVRISHGSDKPSSCPEITEALNNSDFIEFTKHLDELSSLYQLNVQDKKQKQKAYQALHALETDLSTLAQLHSINDPNNLVHKSPVGILEARKGGHPMKLTYFISPYDLLDLKTKSSVPLTIDVVIKKKLGYSAAVCIENSSSHKLQTVSLISVTKTAEGKSLPQFAALSNLNSSSLPACFVLKLPEQLPMSIETLQKIQAITNIEVVSPEILANRKPLVNLIAKNLLPENETRHMASHHGPYFVQLPNQCHSYYMNDSLGSLEGVEVSSIPFTHPTYVPQILVVLRQQVLFNVIICSCIRRINYSCEMEPLIFEVTAFSISTINVSFEHPVEESLATAEIDLRDITNVKCKLHDPGSFSSLCSDDHVSKVLQRCFSIPVTMRAILSKCNDNAKVLKENQDKQKTRVLQQRNQKDVFSGNFNENENENTDSSSYLPQQLLNSCNYQQKMEVLNENEIYGKGTANGSLHAYSRSQKCSVSNSSAEKILTPSMDSQQTDSSPMSSKSNTNQIGSGINFNTYPPPRLQQNQMQNFPAQQQEHLRQKMALQGAPPQQMQTNQLQNRALQQPYQRSQMHSQPPQNKQNTMLMSMLSDVPAANSSQTANAYNQSGQAMNSTQSQAPKPKPQRKRKVANDPGNKSPVTSAGRSPKRKMSEDDFSRDISIPSSDLIESLSENHVSNYAKNPASHVPAMPGHEMTFPNTPHSLDSLLVGSRGDAGLGNCVQNLNPNDPALDVLSNHQIYSVASFPLNRSQSFSGIGPGQGASQGQLTSDMSWDEASGGRMKKNLKRLKSFEECNESEAFQLNQIGEINLDEHHLIINALNDLHPMPDSSVNPKQFPPLMAKPRAVGAKGPVGTDSRRCVSAGVDSSTNKRSGGLIAGNGLAKPIEDTATSVLKKERKRKRAESLDSVKAVAVSTTAVLMPPPLITTIGEVASSGGNSYAFSDICANGNPQTLSPVTFRPMVAPANSNGPLPKAKKTGVTPPGTASPKSRLADRSLNRSPKGFSPKGDASEMNGSINYSPKSSPKTNVAKSGKARGLDPSNPAIKSNKAQSMKSKLQNASSLGSSSTPGLSSSSFTQGSNVPKNSINISLNSPVSPSSSNLTSPSSTSCSKTQTTNAKSLIAPKKKQQSLNAVIAKLNKVNNPSIGDGNSSIDLLSPSDRDMIVNKSEAAINKPDSSSGKQAVSTANVTSSINKTSEAKKYSRSSDQFTMKPSPGNNLKFTVMKNKPPTASDFKTKKLLPGPFGHKSSNVAIPSGSLKSHKNPLGLKRGLAGGVNKAGSNFKVSASGQINSSKASSSTSNPRGMSVGGRNLSNKVSSSNSGNKQKITSSEGISDPAFTRIKIDHLPKIPRTASSMAAAANNNNNNNNMNPSNVQNNSSSNNPSTGLVNCSSSSTASKETESTTQSILNSGTSLNPNSSGPISANQMNVAGPNRSNSAVSQSSLNSSPQNLVITQSSLSSNNSSQPFYCPSKRPNTSNQRDSFSNSSHLFPSTSSAIPSSSERIGDNTPTKFQSCTISSSFPVNTPSANSSDSSSMQHASLTVGNDQIGSLMGAQAVGEISTVISNSSSGVTSSVLEPEFKICDSNEVIGARSSITDPIDQEKSGVSSSSDNKLSTSTPSSPVECSIIPDVLQKPPPLIPTESIDEPLLPEASESQIDSSIGFVSSSPSPGALRKNGLPANGSRLSSSSHVASSSDASGPTLLACEQVDDDDEDEEGLIIDFASSTPTKKDLSVSSTAPCFSKNIPSGPPSSSSKSLIQERGPSLSISSLDEDSHSVQAGPSCSISSSVEQTSTNNTNPNFSSVPSSSSSLSNHVSESPSSQSISSLTSAPRRSPCLIDDELMDEALVGSGE